MDNEKAAKTEQNAQKKSDYCINNGSAQKAAKEIFAKITNSHRKFK